MPQETTPHQKLADALERRGYDPWYTAILNEAIAATRDADKAIAIADKVFAENPKDASKPADDDASVLFEKTA